MTKKTYDSEDSSSNIEIVEEKKLGLIKVEALIEKIQIDETLFDYASKLFDQLKKGGKENIFFSLNELDSAIRFFFNKNNQESYDESVGTVIFSLFLKYMRLDQQEIVSILSDKLNGLKIHKKYQKMIDEYANSFQELRYFYNIIASMNVSDMIENKLNPHPLIDNCLVEKIEGVCLMTDNLLYFLFGGDLFILNNKEKEKKDMILIFKNNFLKMKNDIVSRADYRLMENFSETMKKMVGYLSGYFISHPNDSRLGFLKKLLEKIYVEYKKVDLDEAGNVCFSPLKKIEKIEALIHDFLPNSGKNKLNGLAKYSLEILYRLKTELKEKSEDDFIIHNDEQEDKNIFQHQENLPINQILTKENYVHDLATVPFDQFKKKTDEFMDSFNKSGIIRQFFYFLKSLLKEDDSLVKSMEKEGLLKKLPKEIQSPANIYRFFQTVKKETSKKVNSAYKELQKSKAIVVDSSQRFIGRQPAKIQKTSSQPEAAYLADINSLKYMNDKMI